MKLELKNLITEAYSMGRIDAVSDNPYAINGEDYYKKEFLEFPTTNIIDKWLDKNGDYKITKQVEEEANELYKQK